MASAKIILATKQYSNGHHPVLLRIIVNRRKYTRVITTVDPKHWKNNKVSSNDKHHASKNRLIAKTLYDAEEYLLGCDIKGITPDPNTYLKRPTQGQTIIDALNAYADTVPSPRTAAKYTSTASKIKAFGENPKVEHLTYGWLRRYDKYLVGKGNAPNTRNKDFKCIKAVINQQIADRKIMHSPFVNFVMPKEKTYKVKLTRAELDKLINTKIDLPSVALARDIFVFSTMQRGMRIHDALTIKHSNIQNGRLHVKTKKSGKVIDMEIAPKAKEIIDRYKGGTYIFPVLKNESLKHIDSKQAIIRANLKKAMTIAGIDKHISPHTARHTFAYLASRSGIHVTQIQKLLGHSDLATTERYIRSLKDGDELDSVVRDLF